VCTHTILASNSIIYNHSLPLLRTGLIPILLDIVLLRMSYFVPDIPGFVPISCLLLRPPNERHPSLAFNLRPWTRLDIPVHSCPRTRTHVARCYGPVVRPRCEYLQRLTACLTPPPYTPIYRICMHVHRRQVDRRAMIQCYNLSLIAARKWRSKTKKGKG
jgi:hypothetical protein